MKRTQSHCHRLTEAFRLQMHKKRFLWYPGSPQTPLTELTAALLELDLMECRKEDCRKRKAEKKGKWGVGK